MTVCVTFFSEQSSGEAVTDSVTATITHTSSNSAGAATAEDKQPTAVAFDELGGNY